MLRSYSAHQKKTSPIEWKKEKRVIKSPAAIWARLGGYLLGNGKKKRKGSHASGKCQEKKMSPQEKKKKKGKKARGCPYLGKKRLCRVYIIEEH